MKLSTVALRLLNISIVALVWILVILMAYRFGIRAYDFGYRIFTEPAVSSEENGRDILVTVNDTSYSVIADSLYEKGLVASKQVFEVQLFISQFRLEDDDPGKIKPGVYTLNTSMNYRELIANLAGGNESEDEEEQED